MEVAYKRATSVSGAIFDQRLSVRIAFGSSHSCGEPVKFSSSADDSGLEHEQMTL